MIVDNVSNVWCVRKACFHISFPTCVGVWMGRRRLCSFVRSLTRSFVGLFTRSLISWFACLPVCILRACLLVVTLFAKGASTFRFSSLLVKQMFDETKVDTTDLNQNIRQWPSWTQILSDRKPICCMVSESDSCWTEAYHLWFHLGHPWLQWHPPSTGGSCPICRQWPGWCGLWGRRGPRFG